MHAIEGSSRTEQWPLAGCRSCVKVPDEVGECHSQRPGERPQRADPDVPLTAFYEADNRSMQMRSVRQLLLRHALGLAQGPHPRPEGPELGRHLVPRPTLHDRSTLGVRVQSFYYALVATCGTLT